MKNKNDKIKIIFIVFVVFFFLSWILEGGLFDASTGTFTSIGISRMGLFDIVSVIYSAFYYRVSDIVFLLTVAGCYQVLSKTLMYRKLVDKASSFIKGKEEIFMVIITTLMALYCSISSNIIVMFALVPFIITLYLRNNYNRLTAFSAGFGGIFLGYLGLTYGTYNTNYLNNTLMVSINDWIIQKWVILLIGIVLFNVFSIIYMKKHKNNKEQYKHDMFAPLELTKEELKVKNRKGKSKEIKVWPLVLVSVITLLVLFLGYINWNESFNISIFDEIFTSMTNNFVIADVPVLSVIFGSKLTALGAWKDLLYAAFILLFGLIIVVLVSRTKIDDAINEFGTGMSKFGKVVFIYGLATSTLFLASMFSWPSTIINYLLGNGTFNIITLLFISILAVILIGDLDLCAYMLGTGFAVLFTTNLQELAVIFRVGGAIAAMVGPTSVLLLTSLTYLNIPYKTWIKYIWKFILLFILALLILLAIVIYV